jgi:hypothetical protein
MIYLYHRLTQSSFTRNESCTESCKILAVIPECSWHKNTSYEEHAIHYHASAANALAYWSENGAHNSKYCGKSLVGVGQPFFAHCRQSAAINFAISVCYFLCPDDVALPVISALAAKHVPTLLGGPYV